MAGKRSEAYFVAAFGGILWANLALILGFDALAGWLGDHEGLGWSMAAIASYAIAYALFVGTVLFAIVVLGGRRIKRPVIRFLDKLEKRGV